MFFQFFIPNIQLKMTKKKLTFVTRKYAFKKQIQTVCQLPRYDKNVSKLCMEILQKEFAKVF